MNAMDLEGHNSSSNSSCDISRGVSKAGNILTLGVFLPGAFIILLLLCVSQVRTRLKRRCCWGHVGLPIPMDFLISPRYRLPYILVFAVLANELLVYISEFSSSNKLNTVSLKITYKILILPLIVVSFLGLKFFPLLACVDAPHLFLGHCLGLIYSLIWFLDGGLGTVSWHYSNLCNDTLTVSGGVIYVLSKLPVTLITLSVVMWYAYHIVRDISNAIHGQGLNPPPPKVKGSHLLLVKELLTRPPLVPVARNRIAALSIKVKQYFFPYSKNHKLPLPFLCVVAAMTMFLYQLTLPLTVLGFSSVDTFTRLYRTLKANFNLTGSTDDIVEGIFVGLPIAIAMCPIVALLLNGFLLIHMIGSISKIVKSVAQRGFTETLPSRLSRVPTAWTYLGIQFGYFICAWLVYSIVTFLVEVIIIVLILGLKFFTMYFINVLLVLLIPLIFARIIYFLQFVLCKFVFFEDSKGKFISITNRRLFNWFAYVLFLYNGIAGFVSAIIRVALTALVTLLLLFRLDTVVMAKGFEFLDFGHQAFLGFYYLYYSYNNAVMHTFIYLLTKDSTRHGQHEEQRQAHIQQQDESMTSLLYVEGNSAARARDHVLDEVRIRQHLCRNRWLVAYTLVRNPSLQPLTASNIDRARREELTTPTSEEGGLVYRGSGISVTGVSNPDISKSV